MNATTTTSLTATMTLFSRAVSFVPSTSTSTSVSVSVSVSAATISTAGRLNSPAAVPPPGNGKLTPGAAVSSGGIVTPKLCRMLTAYPDQPTATVAAPIAYSSTVSTKMPAPMIAPTPIAVMLTTPSDLCSFTSPVCANDRRP